MNQVVEDTGERYTVSEMCQHVAMSRQNYYAARQHRHRREIDEELIVELVRQERKVQPRLGAGRSCSRSAGH